MSRWERFKINIRAMFRPQLKSRKARTDNLIIFLSVIYVLPLCIFVLTFQDNLPQPNDSLSIPKPKSEEKTYHAVIHLYSNTFGAGDDVHIFATIIPDTESRNEYYNAGSQTSNSGVGLPPSYFLIFDEAYCNIFQNVVADRYEKRLGCIMYLPLDTEKLYYRNNATITWPVSGVYHGYLIDDLANGTLRTPTPDFIHIESIESYLAYRNFRILLFVGVIGSYLGALAVYAQLRHDL